MCMTQQEVQTESSLSIFFFFFFNRMQQTECKICGGGVKMGKAINSTVQHTQWMMVFYSVDVSDKAEKNLNIKYGEVGLLFFFFKSFCDELRFQENKTREGLKGAQPYCLLMRILIHGLAVGQRRQLKKKIKAEPRSLPC